MRFPYRTVSATISASLFVWGQICAAQTAPAGQPPAAPVTAQAGPQVIPPATTGEAATGVKAEIKGGAVETPAPDKPAAEKTVADKPAADKTAASETPAGAPAKVPQKVPESAMAAQQSGSKASKAYVIGPLDVIQIQVWSAANLSAIYDVGPDGLINMPILGQIKVDGMTLLDLNAELRRRLAAKVFTDPADSIEVNVQLLRNNSKKFTVFGAAMHPGEFPLNGEMTVMDAVATFGGFQPFAKKKKIRIQRGSQTFLFNYEDVSHGKNLQQNIKLQNGDWIFVDGE